MTTDMGTTDMGTTGRSPWHAGERAVQARLGVRDRMEEVGRRVIRDRMPDQHRAFFAELPLLFAGAVDGEGRPWAGVLAGRPGFITAPDPQTLTVAARPGFGDPLAGLLNEGAPVGLLGIMLHNRRRNRANGWIVASSAEGFAVTVEQSFGNCPKYIQARTAELTPAIDRIAEPRPVRSAEALDPADAALIAGADTLFIASHFAAEPGAPGRGVDLSHRGGRPGFVRVEDGRTLVFPDYAGNFFYNTIGNLLAEPRCGMLFPDFERGDTLHLTGRAEILWDAPEAAAMAGVERLVRVRIDRLVRVAGALPFRWTFVDPSPALDRIGDWPG